MISGPSPFDVPGGDPLGEAAMWLAALLQGDLARGLCILAVASVGLAMLGGRLPVRMALRVVLGCFVLLGAPVIGQSLLALAQGQQEPVGSPPPAMELEQARESLPPSEYNPYAGASLRRDGE